MLKEEDEKKSKLKGILRKLNVDLDKEIELQMVLNEWLVKATSLAKTLGY